MLKSPIPSSHNAPPPNQHDENLLPAPSPDDCSIVNCSLISSLTLMATAITPPPSALISSPILSEAPTPKLSVKLTPKKRSTTNKAQKKSKAKNAPIDKPKQTKSRNGCKNCKEKRLKCDEKKPECDQCQKKGTTCKGYEKVLKWRPQEDSFRNHTISSRPRKNSTASRSLRQPPASPSSSHPCDSPISNGFTIFTSEHTSQQHEIPVDPRISQHSGGFETQHAPFEQTSHAMDQYGAQSFTLKAEDTFASATPSLANGLFDEDTPPQSARTATSSLWSGQSPTLAERLLPCLDLYPRPPVLSDYQPMDSITAYQAHDLPSIQSSTPYLDDVVEEITRQSDPADAWMIPLSSPTSSDSSSSSGGSLCDKFTATLMRQPKLHPHSEEMLTMRFDTETCGILSIKNGRDENPWREMLWPLARNEPALYHAISAMTAFHAAKDRRKLRLIGMEHMQISLQLLSRGIESMRQDAALSTTLVLAFCESWDRLVSSGIAHLQGAKKLVVQLLMKYQQGMMLPENEERIGFLIRTWVYMDVIARLTSLDCDDSHDFDILGTPICQSPCQNRGIDPLMGCASTMFPTIGRVGNLIRKVRRTSSNSYSIITEANILKTRLEKWKAPRTFAEPEDDSTDVEQALWTAEAYRSATLLYLHQAVPSITLDSVTDKIADLAKEVLTSLANVPITSGTVIIHIFPLVAAGCEATDPETRKFVEDRWETMIQRMKIGNLDKCLEAVKEVWNRRDSRQAQKERQKARVAASHIQASDIPTAITKRKMKTSDDPGLHDVYTSGTAKRRATQSSMSSTRPGHMRRESSSREPDLEYDLTVRGKCHWAGVMKGWSWEVLLG